MLVFKAYIYFPVDNAHLQFFRSHELVDTAHLKIHGIIQLAVTRTYLGILFPRAQENVPPHLFVFSYV
jgi:hypothetical protein